MEFYNNRTGAAREVSSRNTRAPKIALYLKSRGHGRGVAHIYSPGLPNNTTEQIASLDGPDAYFRLDERGKHKTNGSDETADRCHCSIRVLICTGVAREDESSGSAAVRIARAWQVRLGGTPQPGFTLSTQSAPTFRTTTRDPSTIVGAQYSLEGLTSDRPPYRKPRPAAPGRDQAEHYEGALRSLGEPKYGPHPGCGQDPRRRTIAQARLGAAGLRASALDQPPPSTTLARCPAEIRQPYPLRDEDASTLVHPRAKRRGRGKLVVLPPFPARDGLVVGPSPMSASFPTSSRSCRAAKFEESLRLSYGLPGRLNTLRPTTSSRCSETSHLPTRPP